MKDEEWNDESEDELEAFDSAEDDDEDVLDEPTLIARRTKTDVTDLRRRIEDRLESKRLRETYDWDDQDFDDDFDSLFDKLG